jgi:hypothetical protein
VSPAFTVEPEGVALSEKSAKKIVKEIVAVCPLLVPVTVKFRGFALLAVRPETVSALDCPAGIEAGLKAHVAALLQARAMVLRNVLGAEAEIAKVAVFEPMRMILDRALEERVYTGVPVPVRLTAVVVFAALEVI